MDSTLTFHEEQIRKWIPTGWKVVQKYSPGILLGNWYEDNLGKVTSLLGVVLVRTIRQGVVTPIHPVLAPATGFIILDHIF